jgi:prepilin-type N-terminal cleavage/methylation domain-containing protein/prepilin-type processing-associated H-X9-DG protein
MTFSSKQTLSARRRARGFTLVELLVVIAIIALLVSILLPSLRKAREQAKSIACAANTRHVGQSVTIYQSKSDGTYPASYVYPYHELGYWHPQLQDPTHPFGYVHWSYSIYGKGKGEVDDKAFQCPAMYNGGAPRTNPGPDAENWEPGQIDQDGNSGPDAGAVEDKQAPRMSYAANAAIIPRNKFNEELSGGRRTNRFVNDSKLTRPGDTILAAEFFDNWQAVSVKNGNTYLVKSHRPINPFFHIGSGFNEYDADGDGFVYGLNDGREMHGILPLQDVIKQGDILDHSSGVSQVNAVGRHHPGGDKKYGGTANFLFSDGHSDRMTVWESVHNKKWGDAYYSLDKYTEVINYRYFPNEP